MADELVFVPSLGFRRAHALGTRANVVIERGPLLLVAAITPDRDGCQLQFTVSGLADPGRGHQQFTEPVRIRDDHGRDISRPRPRWHVGGGIMRAADGTGTLRYGTALEPIAADVGMIELAFGGPAGEWRIEIPVEPAELDGAWGRSIDARDTKHGVTLAARTVARSDALTAVELEAYFDPPDQGPDGPGPARRSVRGIGQSLSGGRLCGDQLVLRDDRGEEHLERGPSRVDQAARKHREIAVFPALPVDARAASLEVPYIWIQERTDEVLTVPLPGETDITIAGCDARVVVTRLPGVYTAGSVRVECSPRDLEGDRQLVFIEGVNVGVADRTGMRVSHSMGQRPVVEVPEPTGTATEVTLERPVIQLRGPWRLEIPLPDEFTL